jgi:predicted HTH domain antitoxin
MNGIEIKLPDDVVESLQITGIDREKLKEEAKRVLAVELFNEGRLSLESSAKLAGMHLSDFMSFLSKKKIPIVDYSDEEIEELKKDVENIKML